MAREKNKSAFFITTTYLLQKNKHVRSLFWMEKKYSSINLFPSAVFLNLLIVCDGLLSVYSREVAKTWCLGLVWSMRSTYRENYILFLTCPYILGWDVFLLLLLSPFLVTYTCWSKFSLHSIVGWRPFSEYCCHLFISVRIVYQDRTK